jgi:hypothetical protein
MLLSDFRMGTAQKTRYGMKNCRFLILDCRLRNQTRRHGPGPAPLGLLIALCTMLGDLSTSLSLADSSSHALIVSSISGNEEFREKFWNWSTQLAQTFTQELNFSRENVSLLVEDPAKDSSLGAAKATKAELLKAFDSLASRAKATDQIFVFLLGHGSFDNGDYRFNLVGPDITGSELKTQLNRFPTQEVILVCATPCSGILTKMLSGKNRVVITATKNEFENNNTQFAQFFVEALVKKAADVDKNGSVSLLEAYLYAAKAVESSYKERGLLATEHPLMEDNGDGVGASWPSPANGEGLLASKILLGASPAAIASEDGKAAGNSELQAMYANKRKLESDIQDLKYKKASLSDAEYNRGLEALLVELARTNQKIKSLEKK